MTFVFVASFSIFFSSPASAVEKPERSRALPIVYDMDAAMTVCDSLPLDPAEGIWLFPEDNVVVLIRRLAAISPTSLPDYEIAVVTTSDIRIKPGDVIGYLKASPKEGEYKATLFTHRKASLLTGGQDCVAVINKNADQFILSGHPKRFSLRATFNPSQLMPKLWRMIRFNAGISLTPNQNTKETPKVGMIKTYPAYDRNGSSRRRPRYL